MTTYYFLSLFALMIPAVLCGQCNSAMHDYITGVGAWHTDAFHFLDDQLDDIKIVGYGEDTHGSAEFTEVAQELIQYLAKEHGFMLLILETGFGEGQYLNDYILGARDDIDVILNDHNSTWRYTTEEFLTLMQWLRTYNQQAKTKIKIYGCEMQYVISDVHRIVEYLAQVGSDYSIEGFEKHLWQNIEEVDKAAYFNAYHQLKVYFQKNRKEFVDKTSEEAYQLAYHHVEVLGQFVTAINQDVYQRKMDLRDMYMAENIEWILNHEKPAAKAVYWAHNDHVGDWVANGIVDVTGHFLRKRYASAYYNIATDFGTGDFYAFPHNPEEVGSQMRVFSFTEVDTTTFTYCVQQRGTPNAFVDLRSARQDADLQCYLGAPLKIMYGAGAQEWGTQTRVIDIGRAFDAIIYIDRIRAINFLGQ